jgi:aryl-phospho-beta-D-glucosidase BglC (GH1 family)
LGWNLGNSLDAPEGETAWGNPEVTPELLQAVAAAGFDMVRIPITWSLYLGPAPDYVIDAAWLARVEEVVGYALDAGLHAIINLHHDGADEYDGVEWLTLNDESGAISEATNAAVEDQFLKLWTQIAGHFADHDLQLLFESMNEIHDGYDAPDPGYYPIINNLNQRFVDLVRSSGGLNAERFLVVPGYNTNIDYTLEGFEAPTDPTPDRLILSVHYYDPWSFAGEGSTPVWGMNSAGADDWGQEDFVVSQFDKLKTQFADQGLPILIGEYGAINQTGYENYRRYYLEYVTKAAHDRGFLPVYWDNGAQGSGPDNFGLFDRNTAAITQAELVEALQRAVNDPYALGDIAPP